MVPAVWLVPRLDTYYDTYTDCLEEGEVVSGVQFEKESHEVRRAADRSPRSSLFIHITSISGDIETLWLNAECGMKCGGGWQ